MMQRLEWLVDSPPLNLALDEALLLAAEAGELGEVLRLWEFPAPVVVIGRGSRAEVEVDLEACRARRVPVLRRASGGAAIVAGPGCLLYSVVLSIRERPELRRLDAVHQFVMGSLAQQIGRQLGGNVAVHQSSAPNPTAAGPTAAVAEIPDTAEPVPASGVAVQGTCDLTWRNRKFSGNSLRVTRDHILYHGTLMYAADLDLLSACLKTPPRRPAYREDRPHAAFVTNIPLQAVQLRQAAARAFAAEEICDRIPLDRAAQLATERYGRDAWTYRH